MKRMKQKGCLLGLMRELAFPISVNLILGMSLLYLGAQVSAEVSTTPYAPLTGYAEEMSPLEAGVKQDPDTPVPTETQVPTDPPPTNTSAPEPTNTTAAPTATDTPKPDDTATARPPADTATARPPEDTATPTRTPKPTKTATPTKTPTPIMPPSISRFGADKYAVTPGQEVVLTWEVFGSTGVQMFPGSEGGLGPNGNQVMRPEQTTSYVLRACNRDRCTEQSVMIYVKETTPTPRVYVPPATPTDIPSPTPRPARVGQLFDRLAALWPSSCPP